MKNECYFELFNYLNMDFKISNVMLLQKLILKLILIILKIFFHIKYFLLQKNFNIISTFKFLRDKSNVIIISTFICKIFFHTSNIISIFILENFFPLKIPILFKFLPRKIFYQIKNSFKIKKIFAR